MVGNPLYGHFTGGFPTGGERFPRISFRTWAWSPCRADHHHLRDDSDAANDTGIVGDQNTNITDPHLHRPGLRPVPRDRGRPAGLSRVRQLHERRPHARRRRRWTRLHGRLRQVVTTDANGAFTGDASGLPQGFQSVVAVVVGQVDSAAACPASRRHIPTRSASIRPRPQITSASFVDGGATLPLPNSPSPNVTPLASLTTLTLNVVDAVNQTFRPWSLPARSSSTRSTRRPPRISATTR